MNEYSSRLAFIEWHDLSVFPKKDLPFFIRFTASLCTMTALMVFITYQYPELMLYLVRSVSHLSPTIDHNASEHFWQLLNYIHDCLSYLTEKLQLLKPNWVGQILSSYSW